MSNSSVVFKPKKAEHQLRTATRLELRPSDGISVQVSISENQTVNGRVFDVSPTGVCVIFDDNIAHDFAKEKKVALQFHTADGAVLGAQGEIKWRGLFQGSRHQIGIEFDWSANLGLSWDKIASVDVPDYAPITGAIYKPYLFYERAPARVEKVSLEYWQMRIYDTELLILPNLKLELYLQAAAVSDEPVLVEIRNVVSVEKNSVVVNVKLLSLPVVARERLTQQLVFSEVATPEELRQVGLRARNLANGFRFRYIKTQEEYEEVLKLRFVAYKESGKVPEGKTYVDMAAPLDPISRIVAVYHGSKIVGSVAVAFPMSEETILDTEKPFQGGYPKPMGKKLDMIEVARLCTHPEYRKSDLMTRILEHIYKALICGGRKVVITSTDDKLWPIYKKLGFEKTGMSYDHPYLAGIRHHVITQAAPKADSALGINPFSWNFIWRDMSRHLEEKRVIKRKGLGLLRVRVYEKIGRILKINLKAKY